MILIFDTILLFDIDIDINVMIASAPRQEELGNTQKQVLISRISASLNVWISWADMLNGQ